MCITRELLCVSACALHVSCHVWVHVYYTQDALCECMCISRGLPCVSACVLHVSCAVWVNVNYTRVAAVWVHVCYTWVALCECMCITRELPCVSACVLHVSCWWSVLVTEHFLSQTPWPQNNPLATTGPNLHPLSWPDTACPQNSPLTTPGTNLSLILLARHHVLRTAHSPLLETNLHPFS